MGSAGDKHSDSHYRKHGELVGMFKETGPTSNSQFKNSPRDNNRIDADKSPVTNGRGSMLRRELSDLALGELREPLHEEASVALIFLHRRLHLIQLRILRQPKPPQKFPAAALHPMPGIVLLLLRLAPLSANLHNSPFLHLYLLQTRQIRLEYVRLWRFLPIDPGVGNGSSLGGGDWRGGGRRGGG